MPARCARIRHTYNLISGAEVADNTFYFLSPTGSSIQDLVDASDGAINDYWTAMRGNYCLTTSLARVRVDEIDITTGHVITGQDAAVPFPNLGTNEDEQLPLQCSIVATLRCVVSSPTTRGRVYLPPTAISFLTMAGYLEAGSAAAMASGVATYLHDVNVGSTDWEASVYSRKNHSMSPIVSVDVGTVYDTQRSRRSELVESRSSAAV